jgi:hypothetical protein
MANVTYTVPNKNGSYDGDMVVKQYTSITIDAGDTVTTDQPCRGMFIFCQGNMTVNGTLSMSLRGASANPTIAGASDGNAVNSSGLQYGFLKSSSTDSLSFSSALWNGFGTTIRNIAGSNFLTGSGSNYKVHTISRTGASGASRPSVSGDDVKENPADIRGSNASSTIRLGGGGAGGMAYQMNNGYGQGGAGASGTIFSGGSAGGGACGGGAATPAHRGGDATANGGAGGTGGNHAENAGRPTGTGGAGNPKGNDGTIGTQGLNDAEAGTGGLIILAVGGNLTIGSSGKIIANGGRGGDSTDTGDNSSMGGGSGGGHILILCKGTVTANGNVISEGDYVGNAGSQIGSADSFGVVNYNLQCWGGRGGKNNNTFNCPEQNLYSGTSLTRQGGTGGKGTISIYSVL